ncbi:pyridoxal-phosphate dependent enzyme [Polaribacter cellanae]|uniref:Pyridoxal-phosphate dependent enzyme n=1 Tax=Polaribacter cellanae TaxID=2818493 RepID=A0A975CK99_9FLAO|nr:pyridoxal-phosphate dependent enzyme [Polaribacter cellanae]QTE21303.1 pyridoxal-phosphate dependent enzyme [Polaribacter cellanae]
MIHFKDISLKTIYEAKERIAPMVFKTPLLTSFVLSQKWNKNIALKLENLQPTGAFKLRGAANAMLSLSDAEKKRGVVTMSTGNHGKAVAYVAKKTKYKSCNLHL